MKANVDIAELR